VKEVWLTLKTSILSLSNSELKTIETTLKIRIYVLCNKSSISNYYAKLVSDQNQNGTKTKILFKTAFFAYELIRLFKALQFNKLSSNRPVVVNHICYSLLPSRTPKASKQPSSPSLPLDEIWY